MSAFEGRQRAFTLLELLVVLVILGLALSLVSPIAIRAAERQQATTEWLSFKSFVQDQAWRAFVSGRSVDLILEGANVLIRSSESPHKSDVVMSFDYISGSGTALKISDRGWPDRQQLSIFFRGKEVAVPVGNWINIPIEPELSTAEQINNGS